MDIKEKELAWMPVYWDRFLSATTHFDAAEIGAYMLLIAHQWKHGWIPSDLKLIKKIARISAVGKLNHVLAKFKEAGEGKMINEVCDIIRTEQLQKWEKTSKRNSENVKKRYERYTTGSTSGSTTGIQNIELRTKINTKVLIDDDVLSEKKKIFSAMAEKIKSDTDLRETILVSYRLPENDFKNFCADFFSKKLASHEFLTIMDETECRKNLMFYTPFWIQSHAKPKPNTKPTFKSEATEL